MASADIELEELGNKTSQNADKPIYESQEARESTVSLWVWVSSAILGSVSVLLLLLPRLLLFTSESSTDAPRTSLTPLEIFLSTHFGVFIGSTVLTLILNVFPTLHWKSTSLLTLVFRRFLRTLRYRRRRR
ncbi:hypothetical protein NEOLEDRAFT_1132039 [Neolentinus lepideus HHB14362 ss-1]|uniref:Uncharacterized protein n=1 Tax=Neolentinus lepideus HHB14362 ss-1 TaxID=1314782 RepID=A0A165TDY9_9AGAM|nr:hypothetical protein NEOLEDRAFT_1132039 [Neolentinus lepideus HHB14362 ss-1]